MFPEHSVNLLVEVNAAGYTQEANIRYQYKISCLIVAYILNKNELIIL